MSDVYEPIIFPEGACKPYNQREPFTAPPLNVQGPSPESAGGICNSGTYMDQAIACQGTNSPFAATHPWILSSTFLQCDSQHNFYSTGVNGGGMAGINGKIMEELTVNYGPHQDVREIHFQSGLDCTVGDPDCCGPDNKRLRRIDYISSYLINGGQHYYTWASFMDAIIAAGVTITPVASGAQTINGYFLCVWCVGIEVATHFTGSPNLPQPWIELGKSYCCSSLPSCPCGWGPNGTPFAGATVSGQQVYPPYGVYQATDPPYNDISAWPYTAVPNKHPACGTWSDGTGPAPMNPCWQEYLTMPFCINQAAGVHTNGNIAVGPNGHAKCRLETDFIALSNQDRIDIFNNTWSTNAQTLGVHTNNVCLLPLFVMDWDYQAANPLPPHQWGAFASPAIRLLHIDSGGHIATSSCFGWKLACPNTCHGCTAYTATNCTSNTGGCNEFDPIASHLLHLPSITLDTCCVHGCTDNTAGTNPDIYGNDSNGLPCTSPCTNGYHHNNYDPLANCNDGSCTFAPSWDCSGGPNWTCYDPGTGNGAYTSLASCNASCPTPSWDCVNPGNCQDPGDGTGFYSSLAACNIGCPPPPSWNCLGPGNCQDPGTGNGAYTSLAACNVACPPLSWNCISPGNCQDPGNGTGAYSTLAACNTACPPYTPSWDCVNPGTSSNCYDPGTGLGQYSTLTACQNDCITPMPVSSGACGCNF